MAKPYNIIWLCPTILFLLSFLQNNALAQENSVTIGSDQLKESAVLWLNGNGNQGFLLPAVTNIPNIANPEGGMMVYHSVEKIVYWYNGSEWKMIGTGSGAGATGNSYELQIDKNKLILSENGTAKNIVPIAKNATLNNRQVLTWDGNNGWIAAFVDRLHGFAVEDPTGLAGDKVLTWDGQSWVLQPLNTGGGAATLEELTNVSSTTPQAGQVLRYNNATGEWEPSNENTFSGSFNDLADIPANLDIDATDDFSGNYIDLTNKPAAGDISYTDNNSLNATNVQGAIDALANGGGDMNTSTYDTNGNNVVDNADSLNGQYGSYYLDRANHTGTQDVSTITGIVDNDDANELQSISLSGNILSLSDDPVNPSGLDLSSINTDNQSAAEVSYDPAVSRLAATDVKAAIDELAAAPDSDDQSLSYDRATQILSLTDGGSVTLNVDDADASTVNEIQNISFSTTTNILSLTEPGQPNQEVDLSTLNQSLSLSGPAGSTTAGEVFNLDISGGTGVTLKEGANISMTQTGTELTIEVADALTTVATDNVSITGDGRSSNPLKVPSGGITSEEIANGTIIDGDIANVSPQKLLQSGANAGEVLKWNGTQWAPRVITVDGATITGDGEAAPFSVGEINTVNMATGSVTADKININVAGYGLIKSTKGDLAVDETVVAMDAELGTMAAQDAAAVNITGGTLDNVTITNGTYSGDGSGLTKIFDLAGTPVDPTMAPTDGQVLKWNGSNWIAAKDEIDLSDRNAKKEIADLTYGLNHILNLKPVSYKYKKGDQDVRLGLIAQDVQPVIPEVVKNMNEDFLGIAYIDLLPVVIKAIQEQQKIIDQQQKEIDELKERLTEAKEAPSDYKNLQLQINGLKAQLEQLSNILSAEAKNE